MAANERLFVSRGAGSHPGPSAMAQAVRPLAQGIAKSSRFRSFGLCPAPAGGGSDITALCTALQDAPPVGTKVFA